MDATLVFLIENKSKILLGLKKTGLGQGKLLGIGGKVDAGETVLNAAIREVTEEVSVTIHPDDLQECGIMQFRFPNKPAWSQNVHVFRADQWQGQPTESSEIQPHWFAITDIPFAKMWDDAKHWLPKLLDGQKIYATITFNEDHATVKSVEWMDSIVST